MKTEGSFVTFLCATSAAVFAVIGVFIFLRFAFDSLRFLTTWPTVIIVYAVGTIISVVLAKRGFYEKTRDYIATLDEDTLKAMRMRYMIIVIGETSVFFVAAVILLIKNLYVFD